MQELTLGIEEEYQIVDRDSRELTSFISEFLEQGRMVFRDQVKPEFMQSQIEVGSHVCRNIREARRELQRLRLMVGDVARNNGCNILAAGTHPFSHWKDQQITDKARYQGMVRDMALVARRLLIFGMHVHVGIADPDLRVDLMNQMSYFIPHLLCLSTSSPFWLGRETGVKSYRAVIFSNVPRTGVPEYFHSAKEHDEYTDTLIRMGCIEEPTKIWWDIRPHPVFPTLEFRMCDCMTRVDEALAVAALLQALCVKLIELRRHNQSWRTYRRGLIEENKWRALKDGLDGRLLDLGRQEEVPARFLIEELLRFVEEPARELGTLDELRPIERMIDEGTSADRQLRVWRETGDMKDVVDLLSRESLEGCRQESSGGPASERSAAESQEKRSSNAQL